MPEEDRKTAPEGTGSTSRSGKISDLKGIESEILADGPLDCPDDVLGLRGMWRMPTSPRHRRSAKPASDLSFGVGSERRSAS
jgi:hypothetical protein